MVSTAYLEKRSELETYFDRTASDAWAKLTSDAAVSGIRATVRAGRDAMRKQLLDWMPTDLTGARILDAGCGPGQLSIEAARRGADVTAVDLSPTLLNLAWRRASNLELTGRVHFEAGDMLDARHGSFNFIVAMDSLIHYPTYEIANSLERLVERAEQSVLFTFAPRTFALSMMHTLGGFFPRNDRAPAIEPASEAKLRRSLQCRNSLEGWTISRTKRVSSGFYVSQAMELTSS